MACAYQYMYNYITVTKLCPFYMYREMMAYIKTGLLQVLVAKLLQVKQ